MSETYLSVMKDMGGAGAGIPLVVDAKRRGHTAHVIAEGLAADRVKKAGIDLWFQGTVNFREYPFTLDARAVLRRMNPQAVICSMGSPINLEQEFGYAAKDPNLDHKVKVIHASDFWGSATRSSVQPDLVLAIDEIDASAMRRYLGPDVMVVDVGNHAVKPEPIAIPADIENQRDELLDKFGTVILFAGGGDYTTAELKLLKECLAKTPGSWVLVPRLHPKWVNVRKPGSEETYGQEWTRILAELGDRVAEIKSPNGDAVAAACHVTVSGFSTLMTTALDAGRTAVVLDTPETRASFKAQTKIFEEYPLVEPGIAPKVNEPTDLSAWLGDWRPPLALVRKFLKPLDPAKAVDAIESVVFGT